MSNKGYRAEEGKDLLLDLGDKRPIVLFTKAFAFSRLLHLQTGMNSNKILWAVFFRYKSSPRSRWGKRLCLSLKSVDLSIFRLSTNTHFTNFAKSHVTALRIRAFDIFTSHYRSDLIYTCFTVTTKPDIPRVGGWKFRRLKSFYDERMKDVWGS